MTARTMTKSHHIPSFALIVFQNVALGIACRSPFEFTVCDTREFNFCSMKWVATTGCAHPNCWFLHTPKSCVNVLLEWACNPFCRKGIFIIKKIGKKLQTILYKRLVEPTSHFVDLYQMKLVFKTRDDLQNEVRKMGWLNPTYPD